MEIRRSKDIGCQCGFEIGEKQGKRSVVSNSVEDCRESSDGRSGGHSIDECSRESGHVENRKMEWWSGLE